MNRAVTATLCSLAVGLCSPLGAKQLTASDRQQIVESVKTIRTPKKIGAANYYQGNLRIRIPTDSMDGYKDVVATFNYSERSPYTTITESRGNMDLSFDLGTRNQEVRIEDAFFDGCTGTGDLFTDEAPIGPVDGKTYFWDRPEDRKTCAELTDKVYGWIRDALDRGEKFYK